MWANTIFAPWPAMFFGGHDLSPDASWTFDDGEQEYSFNVESECSYAGLDGRNVVSRIDGVVHLTACINPGVPVPLALTFRPDEGEVYELELKEYASR